MICLLAVAYFVVVLAVDGCLGYCLFDRVLRVCCDWCCLLLLVAVLWWVWVWWLIGCCFGWMFDFVGFLDFDTGLLAWLLGWVAVCFGFFCWWL